jgi:hypothetical protein
MPELMMRYRAATFLIRSVAPEIALGFQTTEEAIDITDKAQVVSAPTSLTEAAMQAMAVDAESEQVTQDPAVEYGAESAQSPSNGTLFEDDVVAPNEEEKQ